MVSSQIFLQGRDNSPREVDDSAREAVRGAIRSAVVLRTYFDWGPPMKPRHARRSRTAVRRSLGTRADNRAGAVKQCWLALAGGFTPGTVPLRVRAGLPRDKRMIYKAKCLSGGADLPARPNRAIAGYRPAEKILPRRELNASPRLVRFMWGSGRAMHCAFHGPPRRGVFDGISAALRLARPGPIRDPR